MLLMLGIEFDCQRYLSCLIHVLAGYFLNLVKYEVLNFITLAILFMVCSVYL